MKAFFFAMLLGFFLIQTSCTWTINQAASYSETERVIQMVNDGQNVNERDRYGYTPLIWATRYSNYTLVKFLAERGAELNHQDNEWGYTALMYSVHYSNEPITRYVLEHGADFNLTEKGGYTALDLARRNGNVKLENLLIQKGAKE